MDAKSAFGSVRNSGRSGLGPSEQKLKSSRQELKKRKNFNWGVPTWRKPDWSSRILGFSTPVARRISTLCVVFRIVKRRPVRTRVWLGRAHHEAILI